MSTLLESPFYQFILNPDAGCWSLYGTRMEDPSLEDVWMRFNYRMGLSSLFRTRKCRFQFLEKWYKPRISPVERTPSSHGDLKMLSVEMGPDVNGIYYRVEYALSEQHPLFLWRLKIENQGRRAIRVEQIEMLRAGFFPKRQILPNPGPLSVAYNSKPVGYGAVRPSPHPGNLRFYSNGWQTWSYSGTYGPEDQYRGTRLGAFARNVWYMDGKVPKPKAGQFISDLYGVIGDVDHRTGILVGFLSQQQHFGALKADISDPFYPAIQLWADGDQARLDPGAKLLTDWAAVQFVAIDDPDPLGPYLSAVGREHKTQNPDVKCQPPTGWCSWYRYLEKIDQEIIHSDLEAAVGLKEGTEPSRPVIPLDVFLIDDGYETRVGDWFEFNSGFPKGVSQLAHDIRNSGFTPGLWLAPFIVHSRSKLARTHRDWLLRKRFGFLANAGFGWNNFNKALDLTHPDALEYACDVARTASQEWGYSYLKLDFLYAAAVKSRYRDDTRTRAQALRRGLEAIRQAVGPGVTLSGCGVPLGSAIGIFDSVRVGADIAPSWESRVPVVDLQIRTEPSLPSARNVLGNIIARSGIHHRWWTNDPDCLLLGAETDLTLPEIQSLASGIAICGGSLFLSDELRAVPAERLRIAEQLFPLIGRRPRVMDWFDHSIPHLLRLDLENPTGVWHMLAVFNWEDTPRDLDLPLRLFDLPEGLYFAREFWNGSIDRVSNGVLEFPAVPAHGVRLVSLRPLDPEVACFLGGNLHISQGLEVVAWENSASDGLFFQLERPGRGTGLVDLYLPRAPIKATLNQGDIQWQALKGDCCRFNVAFDQRAEVQLSF